MATLRKIEGRFYGYFYDRTRRPRQKSVPLRTTRKKTANTLLVNLEREYEAGRFDPWTAREETHVLTFAEAAEAFLDERSHLRATTLRTYRAHFDGLARHVSASILLPRVTTADVRLYVHEGGASDATKRSRRQHLRTFFRWGIEAGHLDENPAEDVPAPKPSGSIAAYLKPRELDALLDSIEAEYEAGRAAGTWIEGTGVWLADVVRFTVATGLRRGELCALRWTGVDLTPGQESITLRSGEDGFKTKTGDDIHLPLIGDALDVVVKRDALRGKSPFVFPGFYGGKLNGGHLSRRFKTAVRRAGLDDRLHFHSLRHTTGSWLAQRGFPQHLIARVLRHSDSRTSAQYMHVEQDTLRGIMGAAFGGRAGER